MKKRLFILLVVLSLISSAFYGKINSVYAIRERACIGDDCPSGNLSHFHYTDVFDLGLEYVTAGHLMFEYDYYISTYVVYENGLLTHVNAPIVTHGDTFWSQTADYGVDVSQSHRVNINSSQKEATVTLTLYFTFTQSGGAPLISDPVIITYTVY